MATWTCPKCTREFGAVGRRHTCTPGLSVDEFLASSPAFVQPVFDAVRDHLVDVDVDAGGDLIVDPLGTKVLFKNGPTFCILDVKTKWVAVGFTLRRQLETGRLSRKVVDYGGKFFHVVNAGEDFGQIFDDEFRGWLAEAYHLRNPDASDDFRSGVAGASAGDPMMPDDVDFEIAPPP